MFRRGILLLLLFLPGLPAAAGREDAGARPIAVLTRALLDVDRGVRYAAAVALGRFAALPPEAIRALEWAARDEEWCVRQAALRALPAGGAAAIPVLADFLAVPDPAYRRAAARVLARCGAAAAPALLAATADPDERTRLFAALSLAAIDPEVHRESAVSTLAALLSSGDEAVRRHAREELSKLGAAPPPGAFERFARAMSEAMRRRLDPKRLGPDPSPTAVAADLESKDEGTRAAAYHRLARDRDLLAAAVPHLRSLRESAGPEAVLAFRLLVQAGERPAHELWIPYAPPPPPPRTVEDLRAALGATRWQARRDAAKALGALGPEAGAAAPDLVALLSDEWLAVQYEAARALPRLGPAAAAPLAAAMAGGRYDVLYHAEQVFLGLGPSGAPATLALARLLANDDPTTREVAASSLAAIGPGAAEAVPALAAALGDRRASVRSRAAAALGRIGEAALPAVLAATGRDLARARAYAVAALGRIAAPRADDDPPPCEFRLPVLDPGPEPPVGITDDAAPDDAMVDLMRDALRAKDRLTAVNGARALAVENMDPWEAERAVELLLPECFAPSSPVGFGDIYDYLGSSEVPATLEYLALADPFEDEVRDCVGGNCHRIARWDSIPALERLRDSPDAWAVGGNTGLWFPRFWSDRFRDLSPGGLRALLEAGPPTGEFVNGWLNDTRMEESDEPLLTTFARKCEEAGDEDGLHAALRALGHLSGAASEAYLTRFFAREDETGDFARAALARRGDPDALRFLVERAAYEELALALLLEARPDVGHEVLLSQLLTGTWGAPAFCFAQEMSAAVYHGVNLPPGVFDGIEEAALAAKMEPRRLALIAMSIPGCRTRRMAAAILDALRACGPEWVTEPEPAFDDPRLRWPIDMAYWGTPWTSSFLAFLEASDPARFRDLLREWTMSAEPAVRDLSFALLMATGEVACAARIVEWLRGPAPQVEWTCLPFRRCPTPEIEAYLRAVAADEGRDESDRFHAREELDAMGADPVTALARIRATPELETAAFDAGSLGTEEARAFLRELLARRGSVSYPTVLGHLAKTGDVKARRELWSAVRAGRYRWICYENDQEQLTLGNDPQTFAGFADHLETNCCRAGYVAHYFKDMTGLSDVPDYEPLGQDGTPMRVFSRWLDQWGGRFVPTPFDTGTCDGKWTLAPEE
jgi:HEAT repeat protein